MRKIVCFISYRRQDNQASFASALARRLREFPDIDVWLDTERMKIGTFLYSWLEKGLDDECDLVIPILSSEYLRSQNCQMELKRAVELYRSRKKPILPLLLSDCTLPIFLEDIVWGDFRECYSPSKRLRKREFAAAVEVLVSSIRYHWSNNELIRKASWYSTFIRDFDDLRWRLVCHQLGDFYEFNSLQQVFELYCIVVSMKDFAIDPVVYFRNDLAYFFDKGWIEPRGAFVSLAYRGICIEGVPEAVRKYCSFTAGGA